MPNMTAFFVIAVLVIVTPGPDTALTVRNTLLGGRRSGVFAAVGVALGQATWTVATSAGFVALLVASQLVFDTVRYAGAAYLAWLGIQALRTAAARENKACEVAPAAAGRRLQPKASLRQGLISNLTNPKMIAFFPALLPQFARTGSGAFLVLLLLGLLFASMTFVWLSAYALVVSRAWGFVRRGRVRRWFEASTGFVLIGWSLRVALQRS